MTRELEVALAAAWEAGRTVMAGFRAGGEVRHKGPDQPVTEADLAADRLLRDRLGSAFPDCGWLSEETEDGPDRLARNRVWIVDPIDGTRSYVAGYAEFAISVALAELGEVVLGLVYNPARADLYWAVRGEGSFRVGDWTGGRPGAGPRLRVAEPGPRRRIAVLASRSEVRRGQFDGLGDDWDVRQLGSTAYKLAGVAGGDADAYIGWGPKSEWDVAAAVLVVAEAGGRVTDLAGTPFRFNRPDPERRGVVAAAPGLHAELLSRIGG